MLQQMGYDCYMVFVNTSLEVALARNVERERTISSILQSLVGKVYKTILVNFKDYLVWLNLL